MLKQKHVTYRNWFFPSEEQKIIGKWNESNRWINEITAKMGNRYRNLA